MNRNISRRKAIETAGIGLGSLVVSLGSVDFCRANENRSDEAVEFSAFPEVEQWHYLPIDPIETAENAYRYYADGSCMYASFRAIVEAVGRKLQESDARTAEFYLNFPFFMMKYGKGGVRDFGSLCGILNGCSAAIGLFVHSTDVQTQMTSELFYYYENEELPVFSPKESPFASIPKSAAESVLCHISATRWSKNADYDISSPQKKERCKRLTCDLVVKTIELLDRYYNASTQGTECVFAAIPETTQDCLECHSEKSEQNDVTARMNCSSCHFDIDDDHANRL